MAGLALFTWAGSGGAAIHREKPRVTGPACHTRKLRLARSSYFTLIYKDLAK